MFQLKHGVDFSTIMAREQLDDILAVPQIADRGFVLYVDEERTSVRVANARGLFEQFDDIQATKTFDTSKWTPLSEWTVSWLSCETGPESRIGDSDGAESLLAKYEYVADEVSNALSKSVSDILAKPAGWLVFGFVQSPSDYLGTLFAKLFERRGD